MTSTAIAESDAAPLVVDGVSYAYGARQALQRVSLVAPSGAVTVLLGPNGAGKTTLFAIIAGLLTPSAGTVRVAGIEERHTGPRSLAALGIVFQQPTLDPDLSVGQNLLYFAALRGQPRALAKARIAAELARFGLADRARDPVRALNSGHRRRVEIARAMLDTPPVLILDEPTVGLDIPTREALVADLHDRARDQGIAILWATHLVDEVWPGDRLVVLDRGEVRAAGTVEGVLAESGAADIAGAFAALVSGEASP